MMSTIVSVIIAALNSHLYSALIALAGIVTVALLVVLLTGMVLIEAIGPKPASRMPALMNVVVVPLLLILAALAAISVGQFMHIL